MDSRPVDWGRVLGIDASTVAAQRAEQLTERWNALQRSAEAVASRAPEAAAALERFKFESLSRDADAFTRALLNQQRTLDEYTDSANRAANAASGLGYGGDLPALRPSGFTDQDVRVKNLVDDQKSAAKIASEYQSELNKIVLNEEIENTQRALDAELDKIDEIFKRRVKADEEFWKVSKRRLDENDKKRQEEQRKKELPLLERNLGKRGAAAVSEGLIGFAFPMLFGQGPGASIFGGLGGVTGGMAGGGLGMALSLLGTAVGTAFDELGRKAIELGNALNEPAKAFDLVKERSLFSSREIERAAQKMQDAGYEVAASIAAQRELYKKLGPEGVDALKRLDTESDRLNRAFADLGVAMQSFIAGPVAELTSRMTGSVSARKLQQQAPELTQNLRRAGLGDYAEKFSGKVSEILMSPDLTLGLDPEGAAKKLQAEFDAANFLLNAPVKITIDPDQAKKDLSNVFKNISSTLNQQLELIDIGKNLSNQYRNVAREQEDLARQRQDIEKNYLDSIGDIRLGIERAVQKEALDGIRAQNDLVKVQGEIRLQQLRNASAELVSAQGADEYGQRLFSILGQAAEIELSTQQQIENRKRDLELELQSKAIETEISKADIAKQVARLNESTAKSVADINRSVRRANEDHDERRFGIEKEIAKTRLALIKSETEQSLIDAQEAEARYTRALRSGQLPQVQAEQLLTTVGNLRLYIKALEKQQTALESAGRQVAGAQPPPRKAEVAAISTSGVSFDAYETVRANALAASKLLVEAEKGLLSLVKAGKLQEVEEQLVSLADQGFAKANEELEVFSARLRDGKIGDQYSRALNSISAQTQDLESVIQALSSGGSLELATEGGRKMIELYRSMEESLPDSFIKSLAELGIVVNQLSKNQLKGLRTLNFYTSAIGELIQETDSLSSQILEATQFGSAYEQALASLARNGLSPVTEESRLLLAEAQKFDILREKAAVIEKFTLAADILSGSMRGLVDKFIEFGSASEAVKAFSDEMAKKSLNFVLDIAFKPVEEGMRKAMLDVATVLGFDISTAEERQLINLMEINESGKIIREQLKMAIFGSPGQQPSAAPPAPTLPAPTVPVSQQVDPYQVGDFIGPRSSLPGAGFDISKISDENAFEDIADLRNLPIERMRKQAAGAMQQIWERTQEAMDFGWRANPPTQQERERARTETLKRTQKMDEVKRNWNPVDAQWQQRGNNWRPPEQRRSAPSMPSASQIEEIAKIYEQNALKDLPWGERNRLPLHIGRDLSPFLGGMQQKGLSQTIEQVLSKAYTDSIVHKGGEASIAKGLEQLRPIETRFGSFFREFLKSESLQGKVYAGKALRKMSTRWDGPSKTEVDTVYPSNYPSWWQERQENRRRLERLNEPPRIIPGVESQFEGAMLPGTGFDTASLSKLDTKYAPIASERQVFALPIESYLESTQKIEQLDNSLKRLGQTAIEGSQNVGISAESLKLLDKYSTDSLDSITGSLQQNAPKLQTATINWGKSLGQVVTGLSLASSAVIGIVGGFQSIKQGGAGNIFSGIGSILTTIGGIGLSAAGMMKPSIPGSPTAAGGDWVAAAARALGNANGNVFNDGELMRFANGGTFSNSVVSSPTLFNFADGGTTRTGLMGEAGPEAIMPLRRGPDGSLGVQANGLREAMGRPAGGGNGSTVLNMSFQSTNINGVEYVSRDQLEQAMVATRRQAAKEGANRGMSMTLDKLQQSPSTRSRLGIGAR
jgi:hypothetical protein